MPWGCGSTSASPKSLWTHQEGEKELEWVSCRSENSQAETWRTLEGGERLQQRRANLLNAPLLESQRGAPTFCSWGLLWGDSVLALPAENRWDMPSNGALKTWELGSALLVAPWPARAHD